MADSVESYTGDESLSYPVGSSLLARPELDEARTAVDVAAIQLANELKVAADKARAVRGAMVQGFRNPVMPNPPVRAMLLRAICDYTEASAAVMMAMVLGEASAAEKEDNDGQGKPDGA